MNSNPYDGILDKILNYFFQDWRRFFLILSITLSVTFVIIVITYISKVENPKYTTYSCNPNLPSVQQLNRNIKFNAIFSAKTETGISIGSFLVDTIAPMNKYTDIVNEASKVIPLANQTLNENKNQAVTIPVPKNACYLTIRPDSYGNGNNQLTYQHNMPNVEIFYWRKTYRNFIFDKERSELNYILIMDKNAIHLKQVHNPQLLSIKFQTTLYHF